LQLLSRIDGNRSLGIIRCPPFTREGWKQETRDSPQGDLIMRKKTLVVLAALSLWGVLTTTAEAGHVGWSIGLQFGPPVYYRPWCGWGPYYYPRPYPIYLAPPPVVIQPVPFVQAVPAAHPVYSAASPISGASPVSTVSQVVPAEEQPAEVTRLLQSLADPSERVRADGAIQLGRLKAIRAIDPLAATLAGDSSPAARESAARALGLIGSPRGLLSLKRAVQVDTDRDVRRSAEFSIEIIQACMKR